MSSLFIQIQLTTADDNQQKELCDFLKSYSGCINFESLIAIKIPSVRR